MSSSCKKLILFPCLVSQVVHPMHGMVSKWYQVDHPSTLTENMVSLCTLRIGTDGRCDSADICKKVCIRVMTWCNICLFEDGWAETAKSWVELCMSWRLMFCFPQGRGGSTGYDNAVALPARADSEELMKENVKQTKALKGSAVFSVAKIDAVTGEVS